MPQEEGMDQEGIKMEVKVEEEGEEAEADNVEVEVVEEVNCLGFYILPLPKERRLYSFSFLFFSKML